MLLMVDGAQRTNTRRSSTRKQISRSHNVQAQPQGETSSCEPGHTCDPARNKSKTQDSAFRSRQTSSGIPSGTRSLDEEYHVITTCLACNFCQVQRKSTTYIGTYVHDNSLKLHGEARSSIKLTSTYPPQ